MSLGCSTGGGAAGAAEIGDCGATTAIDVSAIRPVRAVVMRRLRCTGLLLGRQCWRDAEAFPPLRLDPAGAVGRTIIPIALGARTTTQRGQAVARSMSNAPRSSAWRA